MSVPDAAEKLARLAARFDAEMARPAQPGSHNDAVKKGRIRYLRDLGRRLCAESGLEQPLWVNDPLTNVSPLSNEGRGLKQLKHINSIEEVHHG